jgi:hypothetical protein
MMEQQTPQIQAISNWPDSVRETALSSGRPRFSKITDSTAESGSAIEFNPLSHNRHFQKRRTPQKLALDKTTGENRLEKLFKSRNAAEGIRDQKIQQFAQAEYLCFTNHRVKRDSLTETLWTQENRRTGRHLSSHPQSMAGFLQGFTWLFKPSKPLFHQRLVGWSEGSVQRLARSDPYW